METRGRGAKRPRENPGRGKVVTVEMPLVCLEVDPTGTKKHSVRLYVERRSQVWLHLDDANWEVKDMYAQYMLKGVAHVSPDDEGPSAASPVDAEPPVEADPIVN